MTNTNPDLPLPKEPKKISKKKAEQLSSINLIRNKLSRIYSQEPPAKEEEKELEASGPHSKHQRFVQKLVNSGMDMAQVQTAWHKYYEELPDAEKYEVWQEFYEYNTAGSSYFKHGVGEVKPERQSVPQPTVEAPKQEFKPKETIVSHVEQEKAEKTNKPISAKEIKQHILKKVDSRARLSRKQHIHSILFGLGVGVFVILVTMFGFFNERFIAPFITPSRNITNTPIIIDPNNDTMVGTEPKIIIPKINLDIPVVYDVANIDEKEVNTALERGVVHYPITPLPGQKGNVSIVGHSSNNIFNRGKYKFAFVLLNRLEIGDTFMLNYEGQRYVYKVYEKKIVKPTDVGVLDNIEDRSTATLITCDPPGTAMNRLVVIGEQIRPDTNKNSATATPATEVKPAIVPGNAESLFQRLFGWI